MIKRTRWSAEEIELLRKIFPASGAAETAQHLPGRTPASVATMASKLGVTQSGGAPDIADAARRSSARKELEKLVDGSWL